jgi:hypothetical protein
MNATSGQARSMMLNVIGRLLEFPTTEYILFRREFSHTGIKATEYTGNSGRNNNSLVVVPSIARLTVWQQEHCTLVAPRMYIRSVWHPPQTNCAISVPAPNSGGRFDSEIFHLRAADTDITALVFMQWLKDKISELKKNLGTPVSVKLARCKFSNATIAAIVQVSNGIDLSSANYSQMWLNVQSLKEK